MTSATLPWNQPFLGDEEIDEVVDTLRSGWLTTGPKAARFEKAVLDLIGVSDAFAVSSCTAALHLGLLAADVGPGDEVITPSLTFCAVPNVVVRVGAIPVFVDVVPHALTIDPDQVVAALTARTKAIVVMHYGGHACEMDELRDIADSRGVLLVEDAAHAIGGTYRGRPVGALGDLAAFSFYANKNVAIGEGGMLLGRADLVRKARLLGRHGIDSSAWERHGNRGPSGYDVLEAGLKYNLSDVLAAIGIHQVRRLNEFIARRSEIAARYTAELSGLPGIGLPYTAPWVRHAWHLYAIQVDPQSARMNRDELACHLSDVGIGTAVHFVPVHRLSRYKNHAMTGELRHTDRAADRLLSLPCYPAMTDDDVIRVIDAVRLAVDA